MEPYEINPNVLLLLLLPSLLPGPVDLEVSSMMDWPAARKDVARAYGAVMPAALPGGPEPPAAGNGPASIVGGNAGSARVGGGGRAAGLLALNAPDQPGTGRKWTRRG